MQQLPKLIGEQCRILYLPEDQNQVILGVAGSGKSVEVICRAIWISLGHPKDKILVLTVNSEINAQIAQAIKRYSFNNKIEVSTIYSYFKNIFNKYHTNNPKIEKLRKENNNLFKAIPIKEDNRILDELIKQSKEKYPNSTLWNKENAEQFIREEIGWMQRNAINKKEVYLNIPRIGRKNENISPQQRKTMYQFISTTTLFVPKKLAKLLTLMISIAW